MIKMRGMLVGLSLAAVTLTGQAMAASATVRVGLMDMTAVTSGPFGQGSAGPQQGGAYGMMSPGGGFGPGMMGNGGLGFGMMGGGMMSIRADQSTVKAGTITFDVTNWSRSVIHEMLVVAVDSANAPLPYDYAKQIVVEAQVKSLGETGELQPNQSKSISLDLAAGNYLLLCNVPGHYAAGMEIPLTVTP